MPKDYVVTYDVKSYVYHSDTTDFEDDQVSTLTFEYSNIIKKSKVYQKSKRRKCRYHPNCNSHLIIKDKTNDMCIKEQNQVQKGRDLCSCGNRIKTLRTGQLKDRSKRSSPRETVKPSLSSVIKWINNNLTHLSIAKQNRLSPQSDIVKPYHRKHPKSDISYSPRQIQELTKQLVKIQSRKKYIKADSISSSSESDGKINVNNRFIQNEWEKNNDDEDNTIKKAKKIVRSQDYDKEPYNLNSNSNQYSCFMNACSTPKETASLKNIDRCSSISSIQSSSSFWDFVYNKLQSSYQSKKPCCCNKSLSSKCSKTVKSSADVSTSCKCMSLPPVSTKSCPCNTSHHSKTNSQSTKAPDSVNKVDKTVNTSTKKVNVECECLLTISKDKVTASKTKIKENDSCQIPHECLKKLLDKKYNREIICIHNPPCILINGCLHFPENHDNTATGCPAMTVKDSCSNLYRNTDNNGNFTAHSQFHVFEQNCKLGPFRNNNVNTIKRRLRVDKSVEMDKCEVADKSSQCTSFVVNAHLVSCELRRISHQLKYESKTYNSQEPLHCLCNKPIKSLITENESQINKDTKINPAITEHQKHIGKDTAVKDAKNLTKSEGHSAKDNKIHTAITDNQNRVTKNRFVEETSKQSAKGERRIQVKPKECSHYPPCIKIPKCLVKIQDEDFPSDGIPDCVHTPLCEKIPACYSKAANMSSLYVQHSNTCTIS